MLSKSSALNPSYKLDGKELYVRAVVTSSKPAVDQPVDDLTAEEIREEERKQSAALDALGGLTDEEAEGLEERTRRLREDQSWRSEP